jgi:hypothetical protein
MVHASELPTEAFGVPAPSTYPMTVRNLLRRHPYKGAFLKAAKELLHTMETSPNFKGHDPAPFRAFVRQLEKASA